MNQPHQGDSEQARMWNGPSGRAWIDLQELLDRTYQPFEDLMVQEVAARSPAAVLDVGCGTGSTTLAVARAAGADSACVGVDISAPMIDVARTRAEREHSHAKFIAADAQTHPFESGSFDLIVSRFGVMFFEDSVAAFANLRRAVRQGAELRTIAWRSPADNPFMTTAERAAAPLLPKLPRRKPDGPGQFAFADPQRVRSILAESGWSAIDIQPIDVACTFPVSDLETHFIRLGPLGAILQEADDDSRTNVIETVRAAFEPYVHGAEVRFTAACWMIGSVN